MTCPALEARIVSYNATAAIRAHVVSHGEPLQSGEPKEKEEKPMEDPITIMRGELCWSRQKLIGHAGCMGWLVEECTTHSFGTGLCNRVTKLVKEECGKGDKEACKYAAEMGLVVDTDGDGVPDEQDAFPKDPKEWKDTDGDGVGDNADDYPEDPKCQKKPCPAPTTTTPAAPAPVQAPAPAPAAEAPAAMTPEPKKEPTGYQDPSAKDGLQSQGFSGKKVVHVDGETSVSDWGKEYGHKPDEPKMWWSGSSQPWPQALTWMAAASVLACSA